MPRVSLTGWLGRNRSEPLGGRSSGARPTVNAVLAVLLGIHVIKTLTLGDLIVGGGTFLLALFTCWLGFSTRSAAKSTAAEVKSASRPVLLSEIREPAYLDREIGTLTAWLTNVGSGPALNVRARIVAATSAGENSTFVVNVDNAGPGRDVKAKLDGVQSLDYSQSGPVSFLAMRLVLTYVDIAGVPYYSIVRLSDPEHGVEGAAMSVNLVHESTAVGTGIPPARQTWAVQVTGPSISSSDRELLRRKSMFYVSAHGLQGGGDVWHSTIYAYGDTAEAVKADVRTVLPEDRYHAIVAQPRDAPIDPEWRPGAWWAIRLRPLRARVRRVVARLRQRDRRG
jgi:hypothetical protein